MNTALSVEDLLSEIKYAKESPLRIYLGAAPGVGKTFRMLQDGNALRAKGGDVVIGYVETHGRIETSAQIDQLEIVPRRKILYKGIEVEEMDTDAIIARKPELVLVDELAHTNVAGSRHEKRYEDIEDILAAGIAVFSTCNIQHLESVHDVVERMTGVEVQERVPDTFFSLAREMIIVDVTPDELQARMRQGKIYPPDRAERALQHFFTRGNISMLRELALRELANDVEQKDKEQRQEVSKAGVVSGEKVMVAIGARKNTKKLIRIGSRIAGRISARWIVAYVEDPRHRLSEEADRRMQSDLAFAKNLGATIVHLRGKSVVRTLLDFAEEEGVTQLIIGATQRAWWKRLISPSVVGGLLKSVGEIAVHVYPMNDDEEVESPHITQPPQPATMRLGDYLPARNILPRLSNVETVEQTISMLTDHLIQCYPYLQPHRKEMLELVMHRERLMSTFLETGIAIPHAAGFGEIQDIHAVMALTPQGVMSIGRSEKAYVVLLFLSAEVGKSNHLKFLASIARVFMDATTTREIANAPSGADAHAMIERLEAIPKARA